MKVYNIQSCSHSPAFQGSRDKFIEKIINSDTPKKIKILASDVERICESLGFQRNKKRGSHMSFKISETENIAFVTPHNNKNEISATDKNVPNTLRRIKFYTNLGAQKLDYDYFYPSGKGPLPMDLYYLPYKGILPEHIDADIKETFAIIHSDIEYLNSSIQ